MKLHLLLKQCSLCIALVLVCVVRPSRLINEPKTVAELRSDSNNKHHQHVNNEADIATAHHFRSPTTSPTNVTIYFMGFDDLNLNYQKKLKQKIILGKKLNQKITLGALSIFYTILPKYSSGRIEYILESGSCDEKCSSMEAVMKQKQEGPCLAVKGLVPNCNANNVRCNYPTCKTMTMNDEWCREPEYDGRTFYTSDEQFTGAGKGYLPLGPRLDSWQAFQKILQSTNNQIIPASQRKYVFNAIFSVYTNKAREDLAATISKHQNNSENPLPIFSHLRYAKKGYRALNGDATMGIVSDSIFTLSPGGHHPECYRIYEAIEAGSIPVLIRSDLIIESKDQHPCVGALNHWVNSPAMLVLDKWSDFYPMIEQLMNGPKHVLDDMQTNMRIWYEEYMKRTIEKFEDFVLSG